MIVLDTSTALSWCFEDEATNQTQKILEHVEQYGAVVPSLWQLEVTNALWSAIRKKRVDMEKGQLYIILFNALPIKVLNYMYDMSGLLALAHSTGLTTYDTAYLLLALEHQLPLATLDTTLQKAAQNKGIKLFQP